eukprot:GHRR01028366.1.p1 GENE.GHRR01028366.1~~GHRR01028366.1.p1  ORF type:complete len:119 (+),score=27.24 GHRR01028366.1:738-1094(+)
MNHQASRCHYFSDQQCVHLQALTKSLPGCSLAHCFVLAYCPTTTGKKAQDFMDRGALVPDEVVVEMVKSRLAGRDVQQKGWLLDGYPRSPSQAEAIEKEGIRPDVFLLIDVSFKTVCG